MAGDISQHGPDRQLTSTMDGSDLTDGAWQLIIVPPAGRHGLKNSITGRPVPKAGNTLCARLNKTQADEVLALVESPLRTA